METAETASNSSGGEEAFSHFRSKRLSLPEEVALLSSCLPSGNEVQFTTGRRELQNSGNDR